MPEPSAAVAQLANVYPVLVKPFDVKAVDVLALCAAVEPPVEVFPLKVTVFGFTVKD